MRLVGVVPKMTRAVGTLSGSVKITGSPTEPDLDGRLGVRGGEFGIKGLPGGITDVEIDVEADENEARVTRAVGHFLGGDVNLTARMPLKGGQLGVARAAVTARQLYVAPVEGVRATLDADLEVTLTKPDLLRLLATGSLDGLETRGDPGVWTRILTLTDRPDPDFDVVTP